MARGDSRILNGVVSVNIYVAQHGNIHAYSAVNGKCREHMVKKADSRIDCAFSFSVKRDFHAYPSFAGVAIDFRCFHSKPSLHILLEISLKAAQSASFSASEPQVILRLSPKHRTAIDRLASSSYISVAHAHFM